MGLVCLRVGFYVAVDVNSSFVLVCCGASHCMQPCGAGGHRHVVHVDEKLGWSRVLLFGVCEHLCMCYVSLTFFFPCFPVNRLSDAIVNSLAFHSSVLTPQLLLYYVLIMSLHFCTHYTLTVGVKLSFFPRTIPSLCFVGTQRHC